MNDTLARNTRLAPLVSFAYAIYQGLVPIPDPPPPEPAPKTKAHPEWSYETYAEGVQEEIERQYSFPRHGFGVLRERALGGALGPFTEADCVEAVKVLNEFLVTGLALESRHGDTETAVVELEKRVPGLGKKMYSGLIGWLGYVNR